MTNFNHEPLSLKQSVLLTGLAALSKMMVTGIPHILILPYRRLISRDTTPPLLFPNISGHV